MQGQSGENLAQGQALLRVGQQGQNCFLPLNQVIPAASGWEVVGAVEPHCHAIAAFLDFGTWQTSGGRHFHHPDCPAAPLLDDAAAVEGAGDQWIPRPRLMRTEQIVRGQPEVKRAS